MARYTGPRVRVSRRIGFNVKTKVPTPKPNLPSLKKAKNAS